MVFHVFATLVLIHSAFVGVGIGVIVAGDSLLSSGGGAPVSWRGALIIVDY